MAIHIIGALVRDFLATDVPLPEKQLRARTDCFGACGPSSSSSLRTAASRRRPTRRGAGLSNRLFVCRRFELLVSDQVAPDAEIFF
jgi:hypothetical protein